MYGKNNLKNKGFPFLPGLFWIAMDSENHGISQENYGFLVKTNGFFEKAGNGETHVMLKESLRNS